MRMVKDGFMTAIWVPNFRTWQMATLA